MRAVLAAGNSPAVSGHPYTPDPPLTVDRDRPTGRAPEAGAMITTPG